MHRFLSAGTAAIAMMALPVVSSTSAFSKTECIPGTTDGAVVSSSGPCQGNNGFGNGTDDIATPPGHSNPQGPKGGTPPGNSNPNGQTGR